MAMYRNLYPRIGYNYEWSYMHEAFEIENKLSAWSA